MRIGIPKEIKNNEFRVGLIPASVAELTIAGHEVFVEKGAGIGIGSSDESYTQVGATIIDGAAEIFERAEMIV
ncbi:MAG: alanine dehydrogenase, partial [Chromatiales bacterium]|nr:alanine dehydrogenase [Chromatiales bacterium]